MNMKVFVENRVIFLSRKPPAKISSEEISVHCFSKMQIQKAYLEFEKDDHIKRLTLWSSEDYKTLQEEFFSFFKVVKAAGGVVKSGGNELLVIFRNGKWDLPKGKIDSVKKSSPKNSSKRTETNAEAAIREVMEETGLTQVNITKKLLPTFHIYTHKDSRILKKTYWFGMAAGVNQPLIPQTDEGISIVQWIKAKEVNKILENSFPSLKTLFLSAFK